MYAYNEHGKEDIQYISEDEILKEYWEYWQAEMRKALNSPICNAYNRPDLITKENCIKDWVVVNWAWRVQ